MKRKRVNEKPLSFAKEKAGEKRGEDLRSKPDVVASGSEQRDKDQSHAKS